MRLYKSRVFADMYSLPPSTAEGSSREWIELANILLCFPKERHWECGSCAFVKAGQVVIFYSPLNSKEPEDFLFVPVGEAVELAAGILEELDA